MKKIFVLLFILLSLTACKSNKKVIEQTISPMDMIAKWGVESISGYDNPPTNLTLSLNLQDNTAHGFASCNKFNGNAIRDNNKLSFPALVTTRMMCPNMESEDAYLKALDKVESFDIKGNILTFYDKNGKKLITYLKMSR